MQTYAHDVSLFFNDAHNDVGQILIIFTHLGRARNHVLHTKNNGHAFLPPTHMTLLYLTTAQHLPIQAS